MEFLAEYGVFLAKAVTIVVAILFLVSGIIAAGGKQKRGEEGSLEITHLNEKIDQMKSGLEESILDKDAQKKLAKERKKEEKEQKKKQQQDSQKGAQRPKKRLFVLDFDGDIKASEVDGLRQAITGVLSLATKQDEIVLRLESPGGMVHGYGLAASQLSRITAKEIPLTVCVDKVAASGGYMMACVANKILAAPFAVVGSIGVVAQIPNFHRLLKKNDIDVEVLTAGEHKRSMTIFGENSDKDREKFVHDLEDTHELFKSFVREHRSVVDLAQVANGDVWYGKRALDVSLIDELMTSDEYLVSASETADVYEVKFVEKKSLQEKLGISVSAGIEKAVEKVFTRLNESRFMR